MRCESVKQQTRTTIAAAAAITRFARAAATSPPSDEGLHERPHEQHERYVRRERDPLERDACRYVLARFGHHARQPFAEHA